jgi:MOSC domain-containing protein YiiM
MPLVEICHIYISRGHNFVGRYGLEPDVFPVIEVPEVDCVAGRGLRGDRYFDFKEDYKGQITFFSLEVFAELCDALGVTKILPSAVRRNIFTRNVDLNEFIGRDFEVQGIHFYGTEESRPCDWMNRAIAPGAKEFLKGRGGLRARILSDGTLRSSARVPEMVE